MGKEEIDFFRELVSNGHTLFPTSQIGISSLPDQTVSLKLKKGFVFNVMCVGTSGVGKTSLFNTLFRVHLKDETVNNRLDNVELFIHEQDLKEGNVNLKVKYIESRGFGDQVNKSESYKNIVKYIDAQFDAFLKEESKLNRNLEEFVDPLVHVCIYIVEPNGNSLSPLDIITLRELQSKVNIILAIGKSDSLTVSELKAFKRQILVDLKQHGIEVYTCPVEDAAIAAKNAEFNDRIPMAIISSTDEEMINNQVCRVRRYPWGMVNIDDETHCEFSLLREMLLRHNLYDLIKKTYHKFYINHRYERLLENGPIIDSEMADSIRTECAILEKSTGEEIEKLRQEYEANVRKLFENYREKELSAEAQYSSRIKELEQKKENLKSDFSYECPESEPCLCERIRTPIASRRRVDILKSIRKIVCHIPPNPSKRMKEIFQSAIRT